MSQRIPFQRPRKIGWETLSPQFGRLVAEPFEKGYALTVGHSLRRVLLSVIPGAAVAWVKIDGVPNPTVRIPGVEEETTDVLLNLKKLMVHLPDGKPASVHLEAKGPKVITGADFQTSPAVTILNPEFPIANLAKPTKLSMELGVLVGRGYVSADKHEEGIPHGAIPLDAAFSPITRVNYTVEMSRLGKITDYEKLVIEISTTGAITPDQVLSRASEILRSHFAPLAPAVSGEAGEEEGDEEPTLKELLLKDLEELGIPARALGSLKKAEIETVADLVQKTEEELLELKNMGQKSIDEIKALLAPLGLSLGMRIDPSILAGRGGSR
jgi:DNA-directed RNA polymerase subunit alpha